MIDLQFAWIETAILVPFVAALFCSKRFPLRVRYWLSFGAAGLTFALALGAWWDFKQLRVFEAHDHWDVLNFLSGDFVFLIDEFNAPLIPLVCAVYWLVILVTPTSKRARFPWRLTFVSLGLTVALLSCRSNWWILGLLAVHSVVPVIELIERKQVWQLFAAFQCASLISMATGLFLINGQAVDERLNLVGLVLLVIGCWLRCGCFPFHLWVLDLTSRASLATAILYLTPMMGAFAIVRLLLPTAPDFVLQVLGILSLASAIYASCMLLVQTCTRRFFAYMYLSNQSLLLIGLELVNPVGLTGSLSLWMSQATSLVAFGMTIRAIEGRVGRVLLDRFHGLYEQMPLLAGFFMLAGLASIGFPGTSGFIASELLIEGVVNVYSRTGFLVVFVMALNGIAALKAYCRLFTGHEAPATISMQPRWYERLAIVAFSVFILVSGLLPGPGVMTRYHAAQELLNRRTTTLTQPLIDEENHEH
ncbi:MAG TPA: proton-conducting transporter membrane subunit [Pirellulaceae bacterium]|nr:proton-conducting transporter membrane subunit [Pirellulaceae bacterium]HMO92546.1 proton-conducting transporter membrane subunit [Pirellulaceae bacterium]HMP68972.1 proton-conducting transporter membrane subunit [Pirellulaceae bacterium]